MPSVLSPLLFSPDNSVDIGASGATRPRIGYFGTALAIGTNPAASDAIRLGNTAWIAARNAANSADQRLIGLNASNYVSLHDGALQIVLNGTNVSDPVTIPNQVTPTSVGIVAAQEYADSSSTTAGLFHFASWARNSGTRPIVGVFGSGFGDGSGSQAWGGNFVGYANHAAASAIGVEVNYGALVAGGQAYGCVIASAGGNATVAAIQIQANTVAAAPQYAIRFHKGTGQPATDYFITTSGSPSVTNGIDLSGATISGNSLKLPGNVIVLGSTGYLGLGGTPERNLHIIANSNTGIGPFGLENAATGNFTTKTIDSYWRGRNTSGTLLTVALQRVGPADGDWAASYMEFWTRIAGGAAARWSISSGGHWVAMADNTYDIGASGATRPRDLFLGRNALFGGYLGIAEQVAPSAVAGYGLFYTKSADGKPYFKTSGAVEYDLTATGAGTTPRTTTIPFTDGDTFRRVTITDGAVTAGSIIVCSVRRPDQGVDYGYLYIVNVVKVLNGSFDVSIACTDGGFGDPVEIPPNETITLAYTAT